MSHYKSYPTYKDSGVKWLGSVPDHWVFRKLKYIARFSGGGTPTRDNLAYWNGDIPWVSPKDMKSETINGAEESITVEGLRNSTTCLISPGHVLLVVRSGILKHTIPVAINEVEVALNQDMKALRLNSDKCSSHFIFRWVQGFNDDLLQVWLKQGATVESIEQEYLADSIVPMPSIGEQQAIIAHLDRETTRIDALVSKKTRFIELLREKRQALITHAVTKGLDPNVTMKDSGVEWLGEVPEHWCVKQLKHLANPETVITYGIVQAGPDYDGGIPYIKTSDMSGTELPTSGYSLTSPEIDKAYTRSKVFPGDLVIAIRATIGKCLSVPYGLPEANLTQGTAKVSPADWVDKGYLLSLIQSDAVQGYFSYMAKGSTFKEITLDALRRTPALLPPYSEQCQISRFLGDRTTRLDSLITKTNRSIELLKERRSALITAAVTGQIDLREAA